MRDRNCRTSESEEKLSGMTVRATPTGTGSVRCSRDKNRPKAYSCNNNMHPCPVPQELLVTVYYYMHIVAYILSVQGLTQVEEMLISAVMLIMSTNILMGSMATLDKPTCHRILCLENATREKIKKEQQTRWPCPHFNHS